MFTSILDSVMHESSVLPVTDAYNGFVESMGASYAYILLALCLVAGMFGRRLSGLIRVLILFSVVFVASVYWVAPIVQSFIPDIPAIGIGVAIGIFAAVMSRMIYNLVYVGCIGVDVFNICFNALFFIELTSLTEGNLIASIGAAAGATILAILVRKYLEMIITAGAGAFGVAFFANEIFGYAANFGMDSMTTIIIVGVILAVPMFIYQYYNRVLY